MAGARAGQRRAAALAAMAVAAGLLVRPMLADLRDPAFPAADEFQPYLDSWARVLAPLEQLVPADELLGYACSRDAHGEPLASLARWYELIRAVLAPRRIARELETRYVLVHCAPSAEPARISGLSDARVLAELAQDVYLVERAGP